MIVKTWRRSLVLAAALAALAVLAGTGAAQKAAKKQDKKQDQADHPAMAALMGQYRGWFTTQDLNKDTLLDKDELAKAFRGASARAYDYRPAGKDKEATRSSDLDKEKDALPPTSAQELTPEQQAQLQAYYARFPDYQFLSQLDKDLDDKISSSEFDGWARDIVRACTDQLKQVEEAQKRMLDLQARLLRNPNAKDRNRIDGDLRRERQQLDRLRDRLRDLERQQDRFRNNRRR